MDGEGTICCPNCGRELPASQGERHLDGLDALDARHLHCPRQDLEAIKADNPRPVDLATVPLLAPSWDQRYAHPKLATVAT